jgi:hypothetical protein
VDGLVDLYNLVSSCSTVVLLWHDEASESGINHLFFFFYSVFFYNISFVENSLK